MASEKFPEDINEELKALAERRSFQNVDIKDLNENQKQWMIVGFCLHSIIAPLLRFVLEQAIKQLYTTLVTTSQIDTQMHPNIVGRYPMPTGYRLNYASINNNAAHGRNIRNYDYRVKDYVDLSKLFFLSHMAQHTGIDETCDISALLSLMMNIDAFHPAVINVVEKIREEVRNPWAHCDFRQWDKTKFTRAFQLMEQLVRHLQLGNTEKELEAYDKLSKWQSTDLNTFDGSLTMEMFNECRRDVSFLAKYILQTESASLETIPPNIREQHCRITENWKTEDELFVEIEAYRHAYRKCCMNSFITISGNSGSGKSAIAYHIAFNLNSDGYSIVPVTSFEDVQKFWNSHSKQLFVYDDPVGKELLDVVRLSDLQRKNIYLEQLFQESSNKIIFTCRKIVIKDSGLKRAKNILTQNIVDLHSSSLALTREEKLVILEQHTKHIKEKDIDFDKVTRSECFNFPFLCSMFAKNAMFQKKGNAFFENMFPVVIDEIEHIKNSSGIKYFVLGLYVVFNDNCILDKLKDPEIKSFEESLSQELGIDVSQQRIEEAHESLVSVYLIKEGNGYKFLHDTLYEAVTHHFGNHYPKVILKYCSSAFIREHVRVENISNEGHFIILEENDYGLLIDRYISEIRNGNFHDVFMSISMRNEKFIKCFEETLDRMPEKQVNKIFIETFEKTKLYQNTTKGLWSKRASVYMILEHEKVRPIHWILALDLSLLFSYLLAKLECFNAYSKFECKKIEDLRLIPIACVGGNPKTVADLCRYRFAGGIEDVWIRRSMTSLHMAVLSGSKTMVTFVLKAGVKVNSQREKKITPLFQAAAAGLTDICDILIKRRADVNLCSSFGATPLFIAAQEGNTATVQLLLQHGSNMSKCRNDGASPLYIAAYNGHSEIVKLLLCQGSPVNHSMDDGTTALYIAAYYGHVETVRTLMQNGAHILPAKNGETPLFVASRGGHFETIQVLLQDNISINKCTNKGESPIYAALLNEHISIFSLLLKSGADINLHPKDEKPLLYLAVEKGVVEIVQTLMQHEIYSNELTNGGKTLLGVACEKGHLEVVKLLVENMNANSFKTYMLPQHVADIQGHSEIQHMSNPDAHTCEDDLYIAADAGHIEIVEYLLQEKRNVGTCMKNGRAPLHAAACKGHLKVLLVLLGKGADMNSCANDGSTPIYLAACYGHSHVVRVLMQKGADVNLRTTDGKSPLWVAARGGWTEIVTLLLAKKADVNSCTNQSYSPLMVAALNGHIKTVQELLKYKADTNLVADDGRTATTAASYNAHDKIIRILLANGADVNLCNQKGLSPLVQATCLGNLSTVQLLLENGANMNQRTSERLTPFGIASRERLFKILAVFNKWMRPIYKQ